MSDHPCRRLEFTSSDRPVIFATFAFLYADMVKRKTFKKAGIGCKKMFSLNVIQGLSDIDVRVWR